MNMNTKKQSFRSHRTQSDHEAVQKPNIEMWLINTLKGEETKNVLKTFGIDKNSLRTAGVHEIDRLYQSLFVYSQGVRSVFEEIVKNSMDSKALLYKIWNVYSALVLRQENPPMIEEYKIEKKMEKSVNNQGSPSPDLTEQKLKEFECIMDGQKKQIKSLKNEVESLKIEQGQFSELVEEKETQLNQELKKRLQFETKINHMNCAMNKIKCQNELLQKQIENLNIQQNNVSTQLDIKNNDIESLRALNDRITRNYNELLIKYNDQLNVTKCNDKYIKEINLRFDSLNQSIQSNQCESKKIKLNNATMIQKCQYLEKQLELAQIEKSNLNIKIIEYETTHRNQVNLITILQQQIQQLKIIEKEQSEIHTQKIDKFNSMKLEVEQYFLQNGVLSTQNENLQLQNHKLESELKLQAIHYQQQTHNLQNQEENIKGLLQNQKQMQSIIEDLQQQLLQEQGKLKLISHDKKGLQEQNKDLIKKQLFSSQSQEEKLKELNNLIFLLQNTIEELQSQNRLIVLQNSKLDSQIIQLNTSLTELQAKYSMEIIKRQEQEQSQRLISQEMKQLSTEKNKIQEQIKFKNKFKQNQEIQNNIVLELQEENQTLLNINQNLNNQITQLSLINSKQSTSVQTDIKSLQAKQTQCTVKKKDKNEQTISVQLNAEYQAFQINYIPNQPILTQVPTNSIPNCENKHTITVSTQTLCQSINQNSTCNAFTTEENQQQQNLNFQGSQIKTSESRLQPNYVNEEEPYRNDQLDQEQDKGRKKQLMLPSLNQNHQPDVQKICTPNSKRFSRLHTNASIYYHKI